MKPGEKMGTATVLSVQHGLPPAPARERKPRPNHPTNPTWAVSSAGWWRIEFRVGCVVVSEANRRDHWAKAHKRKERQRTALFVAVWNAGWGEFDNHPLWRPQTPCTVSLTHHGRKMDGDNLQRGFKSLRDYIASWIGVDDGDERVTWLYEQTTEGEPGVTVRIESGANP